MKRPIGAFAILAVAVAACGGRAMKPLVRIDSLPVIDCKAPGEWFNGVRCAPFEQAEDITETKELVGPFVDTRDHDPRPFAKQPRSLEEVRAASARNEASYQQSGKKAFYASSLMEGYMELAYAERDPRRALEAARHAVHFARLLLHEELMRTPESVFAFAIALEAAGARAKAEKTYRWLAQNHPDHELLTSVPSWATPPDYVPFAVRETKAQRSSGFCVMENGKPNDFYPCFATNEACEKVAALMKRSCGPWDGLVCFEKPNDAQCGPSYRACRRTLAALHGFKITSGCGGEPAPPAAPLLERPEKVTRECLPEALGGLCSVDRGTCDTMLRARSDRAPDAQCETLPLVHCYVGTSYSNCFRTATRCEEARAEVAKFMIVRDACVEAN